MKFVGENGGISEEFRSMIDNSNDLMFVKNRDFVYIASSLAFAQNCARHNNIDDIIGKTDFDLFPDESVAKKYREDDEKLLNSGKSMIEFQEEYMDGSGNKHLCLTTKYLLHDKNGEPVAIFGQYHDIGDKVEAEIKRRRDINRNIAAALGSTFFAVNYVNLITHKYIILRTTQYSKEMLDGHNTIEKAFDAFIKTLVRPEFQDKMRKFCDVDTIAERVKNNAHIDCEYLSTVDFSWCRTCFFPTEWDEEGNVTHVLFAVCSIDDEKAKDIEEGFSSKKNLEAIFNEVPGGIVLYEWNGTNLKTLKMSRYYEDLYGYSILKNNGNPDFSGIHPDDLEACQKAYLYALEVTHTLDYVYRVWNRQKNRYVWIHINAVSHPQADGTSLVYAMYSDITAQKDAEIDVAKKQASLETALSISNQLCCEYDPLLHVVDSLTEKNFFNLQTTMNNYPECLREIDFIHPDDIELFINTVHSVDDGKNSAHCDVRAKCNGEYGWYSCRLQPYYDVEKERHIAILSILDVAYRMKAIQSYKKYLQMVEKANKDALCMCDVNITKNQFSNVQAKHIIKEYGKKAHNLDEFILLASQGIFDEKERNQYFSIFNRKNLLSLFEKGNTHIKFEHFYRVNQTYTECIETAFDLVSEPVTGDVVGICSAKSVNEQKMSRILLDAALERDYPMAALVYADTGEYYLFETGRNEYCEHKEDYWEDVYTRLEDTCYPNDLDEIRRNMTKEKVVSWLEKHDFYMYTFYGQYRGEKFRLESKFRYVDKRHNLILATLRNITDTILYQRYKYDSEHDGLTNLYNRKTVFEKSRKFLQMYPEEQFVMLHVDVRHFHLYNTFFGEQSGDKLLCRIADSIRRSSKEYDYIAYGRIESDVFCVFFLVNCGIFESQIIECFKELDAFSPNFPLDLAIGAYWVTDPSMSIEAMFSRATIAAKSGKKNLFGMISKYDETMDQTLMYTKQITSEMTTAISDNQFEVYLQPKYSLRSEKMVGAEALVRWKHPERGMISPGVFIPVFEKNGFIVNLDCYMWEHVCKILRRWQDQGKPMLPVSVNISRVSMYSHATIPFLKSLIEKYRLDPKYLELELTETAYIDDPEDLKRMLKELQEYGFKILMDDFGSGYSSLNTLRELPVDILKLDMKFLSMSRTDTRGNAVLSSVIRMSKLLNLPIVAEGVEKREQADYLMEIGCEYVQGYLFARPMPVDEYEKLLAQCNVDNSVETYVNNNIQNALTDLRTIDPLVSVGVLEYANGRFAYLHTNKRFLSEFDLIENLNPASKVFRDHLDDKNFDILLHALTRCSETEKEVMFKIVWSDDKGIKRKYHGHICYNGNIGVYADLSVVFINVTDMEMFGFDD